MDKRLVLFDLDGTLIEGRSERMFWRYLAAHGYQRSLQLWHFAASLWRDGRALGRGALRVNKSYLAGLSCADVDRLAADFVSIRLTRAVHWPCLAKLRWHQARGDTVVLLTGTLQPIADALAYAWNVEHVCATVCVSRDGIYQAAPPLRHPFGAEKLRCAEAIAAELGLDIGEAYAYADAEDDYLLLEAVGTPIAVMPDRGLFEMAQLRSWQILPSGRSPQPTPMSANRIAPIPARRSSRQRKMEATYDARH